MEQNKKVNITNILLVLIGIGILFNIFSRNNNSNNDNLLLQQALTSKMDTLIENNIKKYVREVPSANIDDILKSKSLSKDDKKYYTELSKLSGLLASSRAELESLGSIIKKIKLDTIKGVTKTDSTITFKKNTELTFQDSSTSLKWKANLKIQDPLNFKLDYKYDVTINSTFERMKDKSIVVKYNLNDSNARITNIKSFIIPIENKSKFRKWYDKNAGTINKIGGTVLFGSGIYIGTKL